MCYTVFLMCEKSNIPEDAHAELCQIADEEWAKTVDRLEQETTEAINEWLAKLNEKSD